MASKTDILNNLREYNSDQIVDAINKGVVSLYELSKTGNLTPLMRKRIEEKLKTSSGKEDFGVSSIDLQESSDSNKSDLQLERMETPEISVPGSEELTIPEIKSVIDNLDLSADLPKVSGINEEEPPYMNDDLPSNKGMFLRPFSFKGRIRRTEFGLSVIIYFVWDGMINVLMDDPDPSIGACLFCLVSLIPMLWFFWAQSCKRCHDRGNSGWYQLIPFYFFILLFGSGDEGENDYGDNPKE